MAKVGRKQNKPWKEMTREARHRWLEATYPDIMENLPAKELDEMLDAPTEPIWEQMQHTLLTYPPEWPDDKYLIVKDPALSAALDVSVESHPICRALLLLGVTQTNIADYLELDQRTVSNYMTGLKGWPQKHIPQLCELLAKAIQVAEANLASPKKLIYIPYFTATIYPLKDKKEAQKIKTAVQQVVYDGMKGKINLARLILQNFNE